MTRKKNKKSYTEIWKYGEFVGVGCPYCYGTGIHLKRDVRLVVKSPACQVGDHRFDSGTSRHLHARR